MLPLSYQIIFHARLLFTSKHTRMLLKNWSCPPWSIRRLHILRGLPFSPKNKQRLFAFFYDSNKCFWDNIHFGMGCTGWSSIFSKHLFRQVAFILFILFFKIILVGNSSCGKELNKFCPPNSSDDLCLLFCLYPSSMAGSCTCRSPWRLGCRRTRGGGAGWCPPPPRPPPPEPTHDPRPSPARWRRNAKKTKDSSCVPELSVFFGESVRGCLNFLQIQLGNNLKLQICCLHFVKCIVLAPAGKGGSEQRL